MKSGSPYVKLVVSLTFVIVSGALTHSASADLPDGLSPIIWDSTNNRWTPDHAASLASSGLTMDIRRFARVPDTGADVFPRVNQMAYAPGVEGVFVVDEGSSSAGNSGRIYHISSNGSTVNSVLNLGAIRNLQQNFSAQGGLRSVAFHPDFNKVGAAGYGKLYTSQIEMRPGSTAGLTYLGDSTGIADGVVSEWTATFNASGNFTGVDTSSHREVLRIAQPQSQHPLKRIAFDPHARPGDADYGQLYIAQGDGRNHPGNGQNLADALGKILRINPLDPDGAGGAAYSVPSTNVFANDGDANTLAEIFTYGYRNPHTFSFAHDDDGTRHIFVGEIGTGYAEEINRISGNGGGNYGWGPSGEPNTGPFGDSGYREGTFRLRDFTDLSANEGAKGLVFPVAQYAHAWDPSDPTIKRASNAVAGGFAIQNGSELDGFYFFTDFSNVPLIGLGQNGPKPMMAIALQNAFNATLQGNPDQLTPVDPLHVLLRFDEDDDPGTASTAFASLWDIMLEDAPGITRTDVRFGQGPGGELYILNKRNGWVYLVSNSVAPIPEPGTALVMLLGSFLVSSNRRISRKRMPDLERK